MNTWKAMNIFKPTKIALGLFGAQLKGLVYNFI